MLKQLFTRKPVKKIMEEMELGHRLNRVLGPGALTALGVGAVIGTGIFVLTGVAAHDKAGPALIISFIVSGLACIFAALCYAEFASMTPVSGSAYTYSYATMGELFAWIIGWDLVLEYTVASATVAHGWSHYFQDFIKVFHLHWPKILSNAPFDILPETGKWIGTGLLFDFPAILIVGLMTWLLVRGIKESAQFNAWIVGIKVSVILFVIAVGTFFINPQNWIPFAPFGWGGINIFGWNFGQIINHQPVGMLAGAAMIFFAYIGFDAVSTNAEEAKNPGKSIPIGIIASLVICTFLYIAVAAVLTGMVPYHQINIDAPVAVAFEHVGLNGIRFLISLGALAGITSVLLVLMLAQPRILLAMARDGLLPKSFFAAVHPLFKTPWKSSILTGVMVAVMAAFLPLRILAELVNIGTLLAFVMVCAAVLVMRYRHPEVERPFKSPLFPLTPIFGILLCLMLMCSLPVENWIRLLVWLLIGLVIYFGYSMKNSNLREKNHGR